MPNHRTKLTSLERDTLENNEGLRRDIINAVGNILQSEVDENNLSQNPSLSEQSDLREYVVGDLNKNHTDKLTPSTKKGDVNLNNYLFDDNNTYANNNSGVEIDGFLFFPDEVKGDESFARREYKRTKIMSGGEFVTRGQYMPKEFSFTTTLDIDPNQPFMYDKIFQIMENKPCEVISPYMGDKFKAEVQIDKTHPKASPANLKLDIKVKEIVTPKTTVVGDATLEYPSTTTLSDKAVNIKDTTKKDKEKDKKKREQEQITYDGKAKTNDGQVYKNPYA